jgi:hypothetical protein
MIRQIDLNRAQTALTAANTLRDHTSVAYWQGCGLLFDADIHSGLPVDRYRYLSEEFLVEFKETSLIHQLLGGLVWHEIDANFPALADCKNNETYRDRCHAFIGQFGLSEGFVHRAYEAVLAAHDPVFPDEDIPSLMRTEILENSYSETLAAVDRIVDSAFCLLLGDLSFREQLVICFARELGNSEFKPKVAAHKNVSSERFRELIIQAQGGNCYSCGTALFNLMRTARDPVIRFLLSPKALGPFDVSNLVLVCRACDRRNPQFLSYRPDEDPEKQLAGIREKPKII